MQCSAADRFPSVKVLSHSYMKSEESGKMWPQWRQSSGSIKIWVSFGLVRTHKPMTVLALYGVVGGKQGDCPPHTSLHETTEV